jgi:hypothetical protein
MEYKQETQIIQSIKEVKFLLKVVRIKPKINQTKMTNEQVEKEEIQTAIKEIRFLIQILQEAPVTNSISRDIQKRFINGLSKEEQDYAEYLSSTYYTEAEQKAIDDMIDCQIDEAKFERSEKK